MKNRRGGASGNEADRSVARTLRVRVHERAALHTGALAAALVAVFLVKLAALLQLAEHPLLQPNASGGLDTQYYLQLAERVSRGDLLLGPGLYFVSPLYIYFLAGLLTASGGSLFVVRLAQVALGTVACGLVWSTAREWFSRRAAWLALVLSALTGAFTFYEVLVLQAALDPFLTSLDLWLLSRALRRGGLRWTLLAGLAFGVHVLNRPNMLIVAGGVSILLAAGSATRRRALAFVAGTAIAVLPVSARNYAVAGTFAPTPSHGGLNLFIGNNPGADGTYRSVEGITPNIAGQAEDARRVAERAEGRPLTDGEVSAHFTRRALAWWRDEPAAASRLFFKKVAFTLNGAWLTLNYSYPFYKGESSVLRWLMVGPLLLVPLGLVGLFAHRASGRPVPPGFQTWAACVPLTLISIALFFVASRYRVPLLVICCVSSGALIDAVWVNVLTKRTFANALTAAVLAPLVLLAAADFGLDDGRRTEEIQMALAMIDRRDWSRAQSYIDRAEAGHPDPAGFHLRTGEAFAQANRPADVIRHLEAAHRLGARSARSTYDLAVAYGQERRTVDAARTLAALRPDQLDDPALTDAVADAFTQLGLEMTARGELADGVDAFRRAVELVPMRASAHLNLAVAYAESGRRREAREETRRALELDPSYQRARELLAALGQH